MLSGSPEDMKRIEDSGRIDEWCKDSLDWLKDTFGKENLVSAVLHLDESTPHIHATVIPIVTGKSRKAKLKEEKQEPAGKKKYKTKDPNATRLCVDDVMTRIKLKEYQNTYAERMQVYGLERGIDGSEARHTDTTTYYKKLYVENQQLQENIEILSHQKEEVKEKVDYMYDMRDEAKEKFYTMDNYLKQKETEKLILEENLKKLKQEYEPYKTQVELTMIHNLFPMIKEQLRIANLCEKIGLGIEYIKMLLEGKSLTAKAISLFSPEHNRKFEAKDIRLKIEKEPENPNKLQLSLNGTNILDWFRDKYQQLTHKEMNKGKGMKM